MNIIQFKKIEDSRNNNVFFVIEYEGGDADYSQIEEIELYNVTFDNYSDHLYIIQEYITRYTLLQQILNRNCSQYCTDYYDIQQLYSQDIADAFENVPFDHTTVSEKCSIYSLYLIAYDSSGNKYKASL